MCYKGKCLYCIPVENGCLVFAVLSAIVTLVVLLACLITGLLTITGMILMSDQLDNHYRIGDRTFSIDNDQKQGLLALGGLAVSVVTLIMCIPSLIGFIFSVLLCNGICKRRPGQVKAYFVYGVVIAVLLVIASVAEMAVGGDTQTGLWGLAGTVVYSLFLWMVHETYVKLSAGAVYKDHIRLVQNY